MRLFPRSACGLVLLCAVLCARAVAEESKPAAGAVDKAADPDSQREAHLAAMRTIAKTIVTTAGDRLPESFEMISEPLFRFNDPARDYSDGSIWGWGRTGRPVALVCLSLHEFDNGRQAWLFESNSLSRGAVSSTGPFRPDWTSQKAGFELRAVPGAAAAEEKESRRLRQIKELARQFTAYEMFSKTPGAKAERYELRLLARPIHRYADAAAGLIDGAIFVLSYGSNPEVLLLIELHETADKAREWRYGLARVSFAELHVEHAGKEVWLAPHLQGTSTADPYWLTLLPLESGDRAD